MSGEESPSNIFEEAGKRKGVKKEPPSINLPKLTREELEKLIQDVYHQHDKFERQLDELYRKSGFSPASINQFLENPQNLTPTQQKVLEERKNRLQKELSRAKHHQAGKPKEETETAKRKGKTLGGRKGWISM